MSSQYPILDNKPIDQWKVTELKEELKRRKLTTRGLKDDLIKRLNEALRIEMDNAAAEMDNSAMKMGNAAMEMDNGSNFSSQPVVEVKNAVPVLAVTETYKAVAADAIDKNMKVDDVRGQININDRAKDEGQGNLQEVVIMGDSSGLESDLPVHSTTVETSITVTEALIPDAVLTGEDSQKSGSGELKANSKGQGNLQEVFIMGDSSGLESDLPVHSTTVETSITVTEGLIPDAVLTGEDSQKSGSGELKANSNVQPENEGLNPMPSNLDLELQLGNLGSEPQLGSVDSEPQLDTLTSVAQLDNLDSMPQLENERSEPQLESEKPEPQLENDGLKPTDEDIMLYHTAPNNQVSEVSPNLGFQVKSDSISTDSVSISEKIELKDNIIADNVKLEQDGVKPEIVEPSSNNVLPVWGESHLMDVEEPPEKKAYVEEKDDNNAANTDMSQKNDGVDVGYSEKLNLDRSSGDDSMEEDVLENKQIDSKYNADELGDGSEKVEIPVMKEENVVDIVGNDSSNTGKGVENDIIGISTAVPAEKRKHSDQEAVGNMEPLKRRRWNSESVKVLERQSSSLTPATTPKDAFQPNALRRNFSRSDSSVSDEPPKERVVPPSQKPPTNALRIDRFLRPFTLKAVQELLGKTGTVTSFWMDQIKTHCFVGYSSMEEAIETRNAVYNLQWPPNGGRLLVAEFVDLQEVKMKLEAPPQSPAMPVTPTAPVPAAAQPVLQPQPAARRQVSREQLPSPPPLPPPPSLSNAPVVRERLGHPPPPPIVERHDPPIVTLDDLFRKTKATPRIYYLPLSEEQVAAKLAERNKNAKQ